MGLNPLPDVMLLAPGISAGRALIRRAVVDAAPKGEASLSSRFLVAQKANRFAGVLLDADWLHVGDPAAIVKA